jgi:uridylate kinase
VLPATPVYQRILLKLSGEALMGDQAFGIAPKVLQRMAGEIGELSRLGVQIGLVIGGGNIVRGAGLAATGMDREPIEWACWPHSSTRCHAGRAGTRIAARVMSAIQVHQVAEASPTRPQAPGEREGGDLRQAPAIPSSPPIRPQAYAA